jgi:hypothetical protein
MAASEQYHYKCLVCGRVFAFGEMVEELPPHTRQDLGGLPCDGRAGEPLDDPMRPAGSDEPN